MSRPPLCRVCLTVRQEPTTGMIVPRFIFYFHLTLNLASGTEISLFPHAACTELQTVMRSKLGRRVCGAQVTLCALNLHRRALCARLAQRVKRHVSHSKRGGGRGYHISKRAVLHKWAKHHPGRLNLVVFAHTTRRASSPLAPSLPPPPRLFAMRPVYHRHQTPNFRTWKTKRELDPRDVCSTTRGDRAAAANKPLET